MSFMQPCGDQWHDLGWSDKGLYPAGSAGCTILVHGCDGRGAQAVATKKAQRAGIAAAKPNGRAYRGRNPSFDRKQLETVTKMLSDGAGVLFRRRPVAARTVRREADQQAVDSACQEIASLLIRAADDSPATFFTWAAAATPPVVMVMRSSVSSSPSSTWVSAVSI